MTTLRIIFNIFYFFFRNLRIKISLENDFHYDQAYDEALTHLNKALSYYPSNCTVSLNNNGNLIVFINNNNNNNNNND